jgi:hypothetical protein
MKTITLLAVCLGLVAGPAYAQGSATFYEYYKGNRYEVNVTQEMLNKTPSWSVTEAHPPLPARRALALAAAYLPRLVEDAGKWRQDEVTLRKIASGDKWVYIVKFTGPHPPNVVDGPVPTMRVIVLMNGDIVPRVLSKDRLSRNNGSLPQASKTNSR